MTWTPRGFSTRRRSRPALRGGPLLDDRGEVVGLNMESSPNGCNLNFAISSKHLRNLVAKAGREVHAWSTLPPIPPLRKLTYSRKRCGAPDVTLAKWAEFTVAKCSLEEDLASLRQELDKLPPLDRSESADKVSLRNKERAGCYGKLGKACRQWSVRVRTSLGKLTDPTVTTLMLKEAEVVQRVGDLYDQLAAGVSARSGAGPAVGETTVAAGIKEVHDRLRSEYDSVRLKLSHEYNFAFPALEMVALGVRNTSGRFGFRTWASKGGTFECRARFIAKAGDCVLLQKPDESVIAVPVAKLSEPDRRLVDGADDADNKKDQHY